MINRVASLVGKGKIEMVTGPIPVPKGDEVLIHVKHCGICGSDVHNFQAGRTGKRVIQFPFVLGHEFAGEVVETGKDVTSLTVGDRVCVEPGVSCGECEFCKSGRYNLCRQMRFMSAYPNRGSMRDYVTFPAKNCYRLPDNLSTVEGALIEPLAVGIHAAKRGGVSCGDTVLILGSGCIGIMTLLACKAMGATRIIVADMFENRLCKAMELGATHTILAGKEDVPEHVAQITDGRMADIVFEAAGRPETLVTGAEAIRPGGVMVTVGNISEPTPLRPVEINMKEIDIRCVFRYANVYPLALELVAAGKIDLKAVAPDIFPFDETPRAFDHAINSGSSVIKCVLEM